MTPLTIIQQHIPRMSRYSLVFRDGSKYVVRAFDQLCAEHLICADRTARGLDLEVISFRRELADEDLRPQLLTFIVPTLAELSAENIGTRLVTTREAAQLLGRTPDTLHHLLVDGTLKSFQPGAYHRFSIVRHLMPFLERRGTRRDLARLAELREMYAEIAPAVVPDRLTLIETARFFSIKKGSFHRWVQAGLITGEKPRGRRYFSMTRHIIPLLKTCEK